MTESVQMQIIAHIHTDFPSKFGIPRQSGLVPGLQGRIIFTKPYRNPDALRGMEAYSHLWLLWQFSEAVRDTWSPTVRPPRLGGNTRMGVFATRSPFRPNAIGLSSVVLSRVDFHTKDGPVLYVCGADLLDGTPIFDIKPYLPFTDSHPDAVGGFADDRFSYALDVRIADTLLQKIPVSDHAALRAILSEDPRPSYQNDKDRVYGMPYRDYEVRFTVDDGVLTVCEILRRPC